jgi:hypothetical protein
VSIRGAEPSEVISSTLESSIPAQLGLKGKVLTAQEEATKDDNAVIPHHLCDLWLARLLDGDVPPPHRSAADGGSNETKVRSSFLEGKGKEELFWVWKYFWEWKEVCVG